MGSDQHYPEEQPAHRVSVDAFWMDRTPVTNRQFRQFVKATGHVTYAEIQRITDWYLHEDALRAALADLVNAIAALDTTEIYPARRGTTGVAGRVRRLGDGGHGAFRRMRRTPADRRWWRSRGSRGAPPRTRLSGSPFRPRPAIRSGRATANSCTT